MAIDLEALRDAARGARPASQAPAQATVRPPMPTQGTTTSAPARPATSRSGSNWFWWIVVLIGAWWFFGKSDDKKPTQAAKAPTAAHATAPSPSSHAQAAPKGKQESKPPVGQDLVLTMPQLRYCTAESVRIDGGRSAIDQNNAADVARFNALVNDFNSRCGSFKFQRDEMDSVRQEVEANRARLFAEGSRRFAGGRASASSEGRNAPVAMVRAIQVRLSQLGYSPGTADGHVGRATRDAIIAFQRDKGLPTTGVADQALMDRLQQVVSGRPQ